MLFKKRDLSRYLLLTIITLNITFKFLFYLIFGQIWEYHLHLNLLIWILWEALTCCQVFLLHINNSWLYPDFNVLICWVKDINVHVIWSATKCAFFINSYQFSQYVTAQRSIIIWVKNPMLIRNILTNLSKSIPFILERMCPILQIFLQPKPCNIRIPFKWWLNISNLFIRNIFFFQIIQNVAMMFCIKTKKHFWIV